MTKPGPKRGPVKGRGTPILAAVQGDHLTGKRVRAYPEGIQLCPWCGTGLALELRLCPGCGVHFQPVRGTKQYCTDQCRERARSDRLQAQGFTWRKPHA
jgi:predicted amidophosphoribosyltransferase